MIQVPEDFFLHDENTPFVAVSRALNDPNGLIGVGGTLSVQRLLKAYSQGIFPWYSVGEPVLWYSPDPRMIITPESLHMSKNLRKLYKSQRFNIKVNANFKQVITHCKNIQRKEQDGTWIDEDMLHAYETLHKMGYVKSVEVYEDNQLIGGLYGVSMGRVFFGESMFSFKNNASKIALVYLVKNMDYYLIDCQVQSAHLKSLGAFSISRHLFIQCLKEML
jgi:leucyl/phenylalanyl-tRNA--protein transferase